MVIILIVNVLATLIERVVRAGRVGNVMPTVRAMLNGSMLLVKGLMSLGPRYKGEGGCAQPNLVGTRLEER